MNELRRTDGHFVLGLADLTADGGWWRIEARLRNGDVIAGAELCRGLDHSIPAEFRDRLIAHAAAQHPTFKPSLAAFFEAPGSEAHPLFAGALDLAGHLGDPELCDALDTVWRRIPSEHRLNSYWLWAILNCGVERGHSLVEEICALWVALPDTANQGESDPKWDLAQSVSHALVRRADNRIFEFLIALAAREPRLEWPILTILRYADHPSTVAYVCRAAAKIDAKVGRTRGINLFGTDIDRAWEKGSAGRRMSQASREALKALWTRRTNATTLRRRALRIWGRQLQAGDLEPLAKLASDTRLADEALRIRLAGADSSALPLLRVKLLTGESQWWWSARAFGLRGLEDCVDHVLSLRRAAGDARSHNGWDDHILSELVMDRGDAWSEALIQSHWDHLESENVWLEAALFVGGPELRSKAHAAIAAREAPIDAVRYIVMHWGVWTLGRPGITRLTQLEALEPLLAEMKEMDLALLFNAANRIEAFDWRREQIDPLLGGFTQQVCPDLPGAFEASLDDLVTRSNNLDFQARLWFEDRLQERRSSRDILTQAERWAKQRGTVAAARCVIELVRQFGTRDDLPRLSGLSLPPADLDARIANTAFEVRLRSFG